ncbi:MAG: PAS domain S-box protein [Candidatus Glassbacteria bacterium]|nr:PAS domain S-box protein [Candidatus Glassbacteria bacterium]
MKGSKPTYQELEKRVRELEKTVKKKQNAEKELRTQGEFLQSILDNIPAMLTYYNPQMNILMVNREFTRCLGWTREDSENLDLMAACYPDPQYREKAREYMLEAVMEWRDFEVAKKGGGVVQSSWSNCRLSDGTQVGIGIDLSERKKTEEELEKYREQLGNLVEEHTADLQKANRRLEHEVAERKRTEEALRNSETLLKETQRLTRVGGWEYEVESKRFFWTDEVYRIHDFPKDPEIDHLRRSLECYNPQDRPVVERAFRQAVEQGKPYDLEVRLTTAKGRPLWVRTVARAVRRNGKIVRVVGNIMDITERKEADMVLSESEQALSILLSNLPGMVYRCANDPDWTAEFISEGCQELTGYEPGDFVRKKLAYADIIHPEDREKVWNETQAALKKKKPYQLVYRIETADDQEKWVWEQGRGVFAARGGKLLALEGFITDITARKHAEQALSRSEEEYRRIVETSFEGIWIINAASETVFVNRRMAEMLGYTVEEMLGKPVLDFVPEEARTKTEYYLERRRLGIKEQRDAKYIRRDGSELWTINSVSPIFDRQGRYLGSLGMLTDITERKKAEEQIRSSLREKEALLQEIYHRVKNNLQVISSLLNLKSRTIKGRKEAGVFEDCQHFVKAMTIIHEKLYHTEDLTKINYREYITDIVKDLVQAYYPSRPGRIALEFDLDDIYLGINSAIPCGLVLNELISNSLKHAFPKGRKGEIKVSLHATGDQDIELVVSDNGIGMPKGRDSGRMESIGLLLVTGLVENQLQGEIEFSGKGGTEVRITFREDSH